MREGWEYSLKNYIAKSSMSKEQVKRHKNTFKKIWKSIAGDDMIVTKDEYDKFIKKMKLMKSKSKEDQIWDALILLADNNNDEKLTVDEIMSSAPSSMPKNVKSKMRSFLESIADINGIVTKEKYIKLILNANKPSITKSVVAVVKQKIPDKEAMFIYTKAFGGISQTKCAGFSPLCSTNLNTCIDDCLTPEQKKNLGISIAIGTKKYMLNNIPQDKAALKAGMEAIGKLMKNTTFLSNCSKNAQETTGEGKQCELKNKKCGGIGGFLYNNLAPAESQKLTGVKPEPSGKMDAACKRKLGYTTENFDNDTRLLENLCNKLGYKCSPNY